MPLTPFMQHCKRGVAGGQGRQLESLPHVHGRHQGTAKFTGTSRLSMLGFTLIELLVIVVVIGILAVTAIPSYGQYIRRAKLTEAFTLSAGIRDRIANYFTHRGRFPVDLKALGIPVGAVEQLGKVVTTVTVLDGAIHVHLDPDWYNYDRGTSMAGHEIPDPTLSFRPVVVENSSAYPLIAFICGYATPVSGMRVVGLNQTNIEIRDLPYNCRSSDPAY